MKCRSMQKILPATQLMLIIGYQSKYITIKDTLTIYVLYQARCCESPSTGKNSVGMSYRRTSVRGRTQSDNKYSPVKRWWRLSIKYGRDYFTNKASNGDWIDKPGKLSTGGPNMKGMHLARC